MSTIEGLFSKNSLNPILDNNSNQTTPVENPFQSLFEKNHPVLRDDPGVFKDLQVVYPFEFWKIANDALENLSGIQEISPPQMQEVRPLIKKLFQDYQVDSENELTAICGKSYQDPNSQIDQAWKIFKAMEEKKTTIELELEEVGKTRLTRLKEIHALLAPQYAHVYSSFQQIQVQTPNLTVLELREKIIHFLNSNANPQIEEQTPTNENLSPEEQIESPIVPGFGKILPDNVNVTAVASFHQLILLFASYEISQGMPPEEAFESISKLFGINHELYTELQSQNQEAMNDLIQLQLLSNEADQANEIYQQLESRRQQISSELKLLKQVIENFDTHDKMDGVFRRYFQNTFRIAGKYESNINLASDFEKILILFDKSKGRALHPHELQQIKLFINSRNEMVYNYFDPQNPQIEMKSQIWRTLYYRCAQGTQEDHWAEIHFSEFLPALEEILREQLEWKTQNSLEYSEYEGKNNSLVKLTIKEMELSQIAQVDVSLSAYATAYPQFNQIPAAVAVPAYATNVEVTTTAAVAVPAYATNVEVTTAVALEDSLWALPEEFDENNQH